MPLVAKLLVAIVTYHALSTLVRTVVIVTLVTDTTLNARYLLTPLVLNKMCWIYVLPTIVLEQVQPASGS